MAQNRKFQDFVETKYMANDAVTNAKTDGNQPKHLVFLYDLDELGGTVGSITLTAEDGTAQTLPGNAIVTDAYIEMETAVTSSGSATVAFGIVANTDAFKAATAKASLTATALFAGNNDLPLKIGAAPVSVLATVATAALDTGKFRIYVEYIEGTA